ncbi:hypothetical protein K439DRAFT_1665694 [Ramaria rubella]|nr:hypothetical protein K439DRAFT_1665694 [Ramaria rubella]
MMDALADTQARRKACEECRRLKLKCDRKFPCHSCMRRGCAAICPSGTFIKGTRSLKTNSLKLHETITEMSSRIVQLEEALGSLQSQISTDPHPLLEDNNVKVPLATKPSEKPATEEETDIIDSLGAFSIGEKGEILFHEATATTEVLRRFGFSSVHSTYISQVHGRNPPGIGQGTLSLPPDLVLLSVLFPFPPETVATQINDFVPLLPPYPQAVSLSESYYKHSAWCQDPLPREPFMTMIFNECYPDNTPAQSLQHVSSHRLSVLFMVFALGTLMDTHKPLCSIEAEEYHTLARACLCVEPVYDNSSLQAVQSMHLMLWYYILAATRRTTGYRLALWGVVIRLCQAIGLHHDTRKLYLDTGDAKLRELVYWEVMCMDFWQTEVRGAFLQAFVFGRPPSVSFNTADCKRPYDLRSVSDIPNEAEPVAWWAWKHDYTYLLNSVIDQAFRTKGTTYSQILTLDQKLRNHPIPSLLWWPTSQEALAEKLSGSPSIAMQRYMRLNLQESSLLHLHRRFFMQAICTNPDDPLAHQFGHSVRAVFSSACAAVSGLCSIMQYQPDLVRRFSIAWSHGFSAAMVLSSLVISAPTFVLARPGLNELDRACALFRANEQISVQPPNATDILEDMQRKAHIAMNEHRPFPDATTNKLRGVRRRSAHHPESQTATNGTSMNGCSPGFVDQTWTSNPGLELIVDPEHWRQYATPAATPTGEETWLESEDAIHVDISPEEPGKEVSNWESFIHQLGKERNQ